MWSQAYTSVKRRPNKYARSLRGVVLGAVSLCGMFVLLLTMLAFIFGLEAVLDAISHEEFLYGTVLRGMMLFSIALFAGWLLAGWTDDADD